MQRLLGLALVVALVQPAFSGRAQAICPIDTDGGGILHRAASFHTISPPMK